jgi:hydrogenase maturation protease
MERLIGYHRAVVIDAIQTGNAPPGTIHRLRVDDMPTQRSASAHDLNLPTALKLGRQADQPLPADEDLHLVGVEVADILNFGERLTPAVEAALPRVVALVLDILGLSAAARREWRTPPSTARRTRHDFP